MRPRFLRAREPAAVRPGQAALSVYARQRTVQAQPVGHRSAVGEVAGLPAETLRTGAPDSADEQLCDLRRILRAERRPEQ